MKNFKSQKTKLFLILLILFFSPLTRADDNQNWKARASYQFQNLSFTNDAQGTGFHLSYDQTKNWGVRGGFDFLNKFGDAAPSGSLGGTYFATPTTVLTLDASFAPKQVVVPQQAYTAEVSQTLFKKWVPALAYKFADYKTVNSHTIMPTLTWYFYPRLSWFVRYFLTISEFSGIHAIDHSVMTKMDWNVIDPLIVFAGYSRSNESFESGNAAASASGFSANHIFAGGNWTIYKGIGIDLSGDYESRNNSTHVISVDSGLFYKW